jgi:two-component system chemotaxis response regulator CheB
MSQHPPLRVLVAEDSATARELLVGILRADPEIEVVGKAKNGLEAVDLTKQLRPSVVTMDIRMPKMDGFEATRQIMVEAPTPIVIVSGISDLHEVEVSMHALRLGALAVVAKPPGPDASTFEDESRQLIQKVKAMAQVKVVRRWPERATVPQPPPMPRVEARVRPRVVAIAASTGGPAALAHVLCALTPDFALPVLVVQHMAKGFMEGFAAWLNTTAASLRVKVAHDGEPLCPRTVYVAPDDRHLGVRDESVTVSNGPPIQGFRPSGTFLFESVAKTSGRATVAIVLTGMGTDGVAGLRSVRVAGGRIIAQDEETSVVFGMPGAAVAAGLVDDTLPLAAIGTRLRELTTP